MAQTSSSKKEQVSKVDAKGAFMQVQRMYSTAGKNLFVLTLLCMLFTASTLTTQAATVSQSQPALRQLFSQLSSHSHPTSTINQGTTSFYSVANKNYVSAELGYTGGNYAMLRARASVVGPWEQYNFNCFKNSSGNVQCTIQSQANKNYVSAELGYTGGNYAMLRARASAIGPWEQFN
jgi:hypothetical protein